MRPDDAAWGPWPPATTAPNVAFRGADERPAGPGASAEYLEHLTTALAESESRIAALEAAIRGYLDCGCVSVFGTPLRECPHRDALDAALAGGAG